MEHRIYIIMYILTTAPSVWLAIRALRFGVHKSFAKFDWVLAFCCTFVPLLNIGVFIMHLIDILEYQNKRENQ